MAYIKHTIPAYCILAVAFEKTILFKSEWLQEGSYKIHSREENQMEIKEHALLVAYILGQVSSLPLSLHRMPVYNAGQRVCVKTGKAFTKFRRPK